MAKSKNRGSYLKESVADQKKSSSYINKNAASLIGSNDNGDDLKLIISFLHLQNDFQCFSDWEKHEMSDFWAFYKKVHEYTWSNVYSTARKSQKSGIAYTIIPIKKYPNPDFKKSLSEDITLFELRVSDKIRVHGFRNKSVFYICWLDRNHTITE